MLNFICGRYKIYSQRPIVMGILNLTPDSFSDGGRYLKNSLLPVIAAKEMIAEGVDIIDIGGQSTRPGSTPISAAEELKRILPTVKELLNYDIPISIDTSKPEVMSAVLALGADIINDVMALNADGALDTIRHFPKCGIILMHMQHDPVSMQENPEYKDIVGEISQFFEKRLDALRKAKVFSTQNCAIKTNIMLDPGFGFGKTTEHNLQLLRQLSDFKKFNLPIAVGLSRKSMLGALTNKSVEKREFSSISAAIFAAEKGASLLRVHNVAATIDALKIWAGINSIAWQDKVALLH